MKRRPRIGHRGLFLAVASGTGLIYGAALLLSADARWWPAIQGEVMGIPLSIWGWVWLALSAFEVTGVFVERDSLQWASTALISGIWAVGAVVESIQQSQIWGPAVIYCGIAFAVLLCSSWAEEIPVKDTDDEHRVVT